MTIKGKIGINEPKKNENRGVHSKSYICIGTGHFPSSDHSYIKATHHECKNSKEERFPLWLLRTLLCVWMRCCDHLESSTQKEIHTIRIDLHFYETFITGNWESFLCNSIVYTLRVKTWGHNLLELLHNGECIWTPKWLLWPKQIHDLAVTCRSHHPQ